MQAFQVFVSGQQTPLALAHLKKHLEDRKIALDEARVDASCPKFNLRDHPDWKTFPLVKQDCAVFGHHIKAAAVKFLNTLDPSVMKDFQPYISLTWTIDTPIQDKLKKGKLAPLIDCLNRMELKESAAHIQDFSQRFQVVKMPANAKWSDWLKFIDDCNIPKHWTNSTDFSKVLQLFGVPDEQVPSILNQKFVEDDGLSVELRDYSVRWLSKALCAFSCSIMTDLINLLASMSGFNSLKKEEDVVKMIESFGTLKDCKFKRCPDALLLDLEKDDLFTWWVVQSIRPPQKVLVQLPEGQRFDVLEGMCKKFGDHVTVFRDCDSKNQPALINLFHLE